MSALLRFLGVDAPALQRRGAGAAAALGLAAAASVTAAVLIGFAAQIALAERLSPAVAALVVAAAALVVAGGCLAWAKSTMRRARRDVSRAVRTSALMTLAPPAVALVRRRLGVAGVVAAIGAGFWLARRLPGERGDASSARANDGGGNRPAR